MKIKVAIDLTPLYSEHQFRGIGFYTKRLIEAVEKEKGTNIEFEFIKSADKFRFIKTDLVHYPYFDFFQTTLPLKKIKPTVVTVYDTIPLIFPKHFPPGLKGKINFQIQKYSIKSVFAVITISENSKKDIVKYLGVPEEKIFVTYLASGNEFRKLKIKNLKLKIKQKYQLPDNFILYVGDVNWNKNIIGLIKAFAEIEQRTKNIEQRLGLILVGKAFKDENLKETKDILQLIKLLNLNDKIRFLGFVPTEDLVAIYNLATIYCQPSFDEGFGLPVLEAMACGCPVVSAKTGSLPEICGKAAVMVDPYSIDSITWGMREAIDNREKLIKKGFIQSRQFSWRKTAEKTINVYEKMV